MSNPRLFVNTAPAGSRDDHAQQEVAPRPVAEIMAQLARLQQHGPGRFLDLSGPEPTAHPELDRIVRAAVAAGFGVRIDTGAELGTERLSALANAGCSIVRCRRYAEDDDAHDAIVGRPGAGAGLRATLAAIDATAGLKPEVTTPTIAPALPHLAALSAAAGARGLPLQLTAPPRGVAAGDRPDPSALQEALTLARRAAEAAGTALSWAGLTGPPPCQPRASEPPEATPAALDALLAGVPQPDLAAGVRVGGADPDGLTALLRRGADPRDALLWLAALRAPVVDLPATWGGAAPPDAPLPAGFADVLEDEGLDAALPQLPVEVPAPGRRVALLTPAVSDGLLFRLTLPALARALAAAGADVAHIHPWGEAPVPADGEPPQVDVGTLTRRAAAHAPDLVIVPSWAYLDAGLAAAGPGARVAVFDGHLLHGAPEALPADPRWVCHAVFPGYAHLYLRRGAPPGRLAWRPYPVARATLPEPVPVERADTIFCGGNQRRDGATLVGAASRLPPGRPLALWTHHPPPPGLPPRLVWHGGAGLRRFVEALAAARFAVVPVRYDPDAAAGLTVVALAHALGRPVVASAIPGMLDHVRHGVDGLLVPVGDARALAAAIRRLDADDALLTTLAEGARASGAAADVGPWATELLCGVRRPRAVGAPGAWRSW